MPEERSGAAILVECLVRQGVEFVFGYPGGAAHTEMLLYGDQVAGTMEDEAKALV